MRVYAGLFIRANRDTHTHIRTYIRAGCCYLDAKRNGNKSHTQKGKFVIISKEYQKQKKGKTKNKSTFVSLLYISETI